MSDLFGNHIVEFPIRWLLCCTSADFLSHVGTELTFSGFLIRNKRSKCIFSGGQNAV